jgi:hypothetical protein
MLERPDTAPVDEDAEIEAARALWREYHSWRHHRGLTPSRRFLELTWEFHDKVSQGGFPCFPWLTDRVDYP